MKRIEALKKLEAMGEDWDEATIETSRGSFFCGKLVAVPQVLFDCEQGRKNLGTVRSSEEFLDKIEGRIKSITI